MVTAGVQGQHNSVYKYPILVSHFVKCHVWGVFFYPVVFRILCDKLLVTDT